MKIILLKKASIYTALLLSSFVFGQKSGDLDLTFNTGTSADNVVSDVVRQNDGKYVLSGQFSIFNSNSNAAKFVRLNYNGSISATAQNIPTDKSYYITAIQPDQKIFLATYGLFQRFNTDFSVDNSFSLSQFTSVPSANKIVPLSNGKILVGLITNGYFTKGLLRLNSDGSTDASFNAGTSANDGVYQIVVQPDGKILIAGYFTKYNGTDRYRFARLNADGSLDLTFKTSLPNGTNINAIAVQPDGKILIGGNFKTYNSLERDCIARLNIDGTLDSTFLTPYWTSFIGRINSIVVANDGKIYVGGINIPQNFCRLNANGSRDTTFTSLGANGEVSAMIKDPDGKIVIAGNFATFNQPNGINQYGIVRIYGDSVLGTSEIQSQNKIQIYPNPAKDILTIKTENNQKLSTADLYSSNGIFIKQIEFKSNSEINVSQLPKGVYILKIKSENFYSSTKFIKN
ncbi:T9SS type A sorting domain-containing protein [Epilithonimonas sp. UC225_85]|uniref:T9SS type A sorting domain-containing protein n=1 Tax=Epilithonimonas sp. UC225_85 TaxID=3350167 RepID=UPI0036D23C46